VARIRLPVGPNPDQPPSPAADRPIFRTRHRLTHKREFDAVYNGKARKSPPNPHSPGAAFTVFAIPNTLGHCRLGLSVGKRIGNAPQRNAFKRRIREAFRLARPRWDSAPAPMGLDLVVNALPHEPGSLDHYEQMLTWCVDELRALHAKRTSRTKRGELRNAPSSTDPSDAP
jgi:ribonuclease P protein component